MGVKRATATTMGNEDVLDRVVGENMNQGQGLVRSSGNIPF